MQNFLLNSKIFLKKFSDVGKFGQNRFFWPTLEKPTFDPRIGLNRILFNGDIILKILNFGLYRDFGEQSIIEKNKNFVPLHNQHFGQHSPWAYLVQNLILIPMVVKSTFYDVGNVGQNRFF